MTDLELIARLDDAPEAPERRSPIEEAPVIPPSISLRDWFAGMAMQGELANPNGSGKINNIVNGSYRIADAMLTARKQP